ncbi:ankyrin repeat domain-containing protein SOWAHC-like [Nematolebias whitei]|uniref:ankyrin repeat domain-containing protein SOWAHC-like n=1 Tax=Nematolebias whitei TaxID=451745 RepID=UPI00189B9B2C|nr:ankyrin repeat domain-containing protein SOWAHC-like [Nematolebias whitei]
MASELTQESVLDFLQERGGKATNAELLEHFKAVLSAEEPRRRAAVRQAFKTYVDHVAFVKTERGVKHVRVKKRFRGSTCSGAESPGDAAPVRQVSGDDAAPRAPTPGAGSGNEKARVPRFVAAESLAERTEQNRARLEFVRLVEDVDSAGMGNRGSVKRPSRSVKVQQGEPAIPKITVDEALPLPDEEAALDLPGPEGTGLGPKKRPVETPGSPKASNAVDDESRVSLSESEGNVTPTHSRKHFIQVMINSSPEVRRSASLRNSVHRSSRRNSDSSSQVSTVVEDDGMTVTLDPVEHEWMLCASDGEWTSLRRLLAEEPSLVQKKDFVTGFTCLHWAAKQGKHELMALILHFAKEHKVPISVDVRSNMGYTPLHVAAMHNHMEVVKLLVGAFNADVEVRDYSGRKACQYLANSASVDIQDIVGAYKHSESENTDRRGEGRWRFSKVLQPSLRPQLLNDDSLEAAGQPGEKPIRRRSSFNVIKPKMQKLRLRASQIVHSASFNDGDNVDVFRRGSFKSRPHTHFFG